jgi:TonB family protein
MLESVFRSCRASNERRFLPTLSHVMMTMLLGVLPCVAQTQEQGARERKLIIRVEPEYPETLKRLYIGGVVRVELKVEPNGTVTSTKLLGGSPILGQSTMKAIKQWKYAPAASDETLTVKVEFDPHR